MEDFGLVEADFQQYYHLDLESFYFQMVNEKIGFLRYSRLFENLSSKSRIMRKLSPASSWSWHDEVSSRMLSELSELKALTYNTQRKKGTQPLKPNEQFQPDYVKIAKEEYIEWQKEQQEQQEDADAMRSFWQSRNPAVKII